MSSLMSRQLLLRKESLGAVVALVISHLKKKWLCSVDNISCFSILLDIKSFHVFNSPSDASVSDDRSGLKRIRTTSRTPSRGRRAHLCGRPCGSCAAAPAQTFSDRAHTERAGRLMEKKNGHCCDAAVVVVESHDSQRMRPKGWSPRSRLNSYQLVGVIYFEVKAIVYRSKGKSFWW